MVELQHKFPAEFFEEEIRCGFRVTKKMKEIWAVEIDLLLKLLEVCENHNLKIFAFGGTVLGAVRHKGFIPWDDDIDVGMLREDYDRLVRIAPGEFNFPYFFQHNSTDTRYVRAHAQLRNSQTTGILQCEFDKKLPFNQGIFIDIFVFDGVPDTRFGRFIHYKKIAMMQRCLNNIMPSSGRRKSLKSKLLNLALKIAGMADYRIAYEKIENALRKCKIEDHKYIARPAFKRLKKDIVDKHLYDELQMMEFEDIKIPVPVEFDKILKANYGDYMKFVKGTATHGGVVFDTEKPWTEYF